MTRCHLAVSIGTIVWVAGLASAQPAQPFNPPLVNWTAPAYWTPPAGLQVRQHLTGSGATGLSVSTAATSETTLTGSLPFYAVTPCRLVDTRSDGSGAYTDGQTRVYDFSTNTNCTGLPSTAQAWSLNIAMQVVSHQAFLTAWPDSESQPVVATLVAYPTGLFYNNAAIVPTGNGDKIDVYCQYAANVVIDVNGYYGQNGIAVTPNPMQLAMLQWYKAADVPTHFTAGGDINQPYDLAFDGAHIWVANEGGGSVTELNASDGSKVGTFTAAGDISFPIGLAFDGAHIWVANVGSVTELNASDGSKVGTFTAGGDIHRPTALAFDGAHIWAANNTGNSVTELNASDGSKVGTFTAGGDINDPIGLAFDGGHIWVANNGGSSVTELNASDGSKVGTFTAGGDINKPEGLAFDGAHIWVANFGGGSVTELNGSDGSKVGTFTAGGDISGPFGFAFDGAHIWVANYGGGTVTELNASDGSKVGTFTAGGDMSAPNGLAFDGAHIWVANYGGNSLDKL